MKIQIVVLIILIEQMFSFDIMAQAIGGGGAAPTGLSSFDTSSFGATIKEKEASASKTIGTFYIDDNWNKGEIHLINKQIVKDFPLKYDIKNNVLEVKVYTKIKVCPSSIISKFYWQPENDYRVKQFVNCKEYKLNDGIPIIGFFEVVHDQEQKYKLFAKTNLKIIKPDYNVALSVGDRDSKIVKKEQYYLVDGNTAYLLTKNKKKNLALFQQKELLVKNYIKENKLKFTEKNDLVKILIYYNSLKN